MKSGRGRKGRKGRRSAKGDSDGDDEPDPRDTPESPQQEELPVFASVVKMVTFHSYPDYQLPWQKQPQEQTSGSGFVISGRKGSDERFVLTNAHVVEYNTYLQVKRRGDDEKFSARVIAMGWECDLALVAVNDQAFFDGLEPVQFAKKLPSLEDAVMCAGYPIGGDALSVTSGVVSRVEVTEYTQCSMDLLSIQIDAAINPGNSGGPAFNGQGQCVGVAFESMEAAEAENIGYIIPIMVVEHFLRDVATSGQYRGFPSLGLGIQEMENASLREAFQMRPKERGVLVRTVAQTGCCGGKVRPGDVLLEFDGQAIGWDGTVPLRPHERVSYKWPVAKKYVGDEAEVLLLRDGERRKELVQLSLLHKLVPTHLPRGLPTPSYYIFGGIVFEGLSIGYMDDQWQEDWYLRGPLDLRHRCFHQSAESGEHELVIIAQILAHDLTVGYDHCEKQTVDRVCGEKVHNLLGLCRTIRQHRGEYIRIDLWNDVGVIILPREAAAAANPAMMREHCIRSDISDDLARRLAEEEESAGPGP